MALSYRTAGLGSAADPDPGLVQALQRDLRRLGYLKRGIDGVLGEGTRSAVRRLQFDLLHNFGGSTGGDGGAPVAIASFNKGVHVLSGIVDPAVADSIEALLADERATKLPNHSDPAAANRAALARLANAGSTIAPVPFLFAIFAQESGSEHYAVPAGAADQDDYVTLGLDCNSDAPDEVTSRGYGLGQYTIFHHPPRADELALFIADPLRNAEKASDRLRDKFDNFIVGKTADTRADDRAAEHPEISLRLCRYPRTDQRYMTACSNCAHEVGKVDIGPDRPLYPDASQTYGEAPHDAEPAYRNVPDRAAFLCDWPYAVRRYNGSGPDSFNYQACVLLFLVAQPPAGAGAVT